MTEQPAEEQPRPRIRVVTRRDWLGQYDTEDEVEAESVEAAAMWDPLLWRDNP